MLIAPRQRAPANGAGGWAGGGGGKTKRHTTEVWEEYDDKFPPADESESAIFEVVDMKG